MKVDAPGGIALASPQSGQRALAGETALLLASLIRTMPAAVEKMAPSDLRQILSDPVRLSALVRKAGLQSHVESVERQHTAHATLQDVLTRVSPRHLDQLLATLDSASHPAVNQEPSYGASASLGEPGSSRGGQILDNLAMQPPRLQGTAEEANAAEERKFQHDGDAHRAQFPPVPTPAFSSWVPFLNLAASWPRSLSLAVVGLCLAFIAGLLLA